MAIIATASNYYVMEGGGFFILQLDGLVASDTVIGVSSADGSIADVAGPTVTVLANTSFVQVNITSTLSGSTPGEIGSTIFTFSLGAQVYAPTIRVLEADNLGSPTGIALAGSTVAENSAAGTVVGQLSTSDPDDTVFTYGLNDTSFFVISGDNIVVGPSANLDFEARSTYYLQALTTDGAGHMFVKNETITVSNVNEPPTVSIPAGLVYSVAENASFSVTFSVSDQDGDANGLSSVSGDPGYSISGGVGTITAGLHAYMLTFNPHDFENPTDADYDNVYEIVVYATDGNVTVPYTFQFTVTNVSPELVDGTPNPDQLVGGSDIDYITGFAGKDVLTGNAGADHFIFTALNDSKKGAARDVITDFHHLVDQIDLHDIDAKKKTMIDEDFKFIGSKAFHHKAGELHFIKQNRPGHAHDKTIVEGDVNGDGKADFQIELKGLIKLTLPDFIL